MLAPLAEEVRGKPTLKIDLLQVHTFYVIPWQWNRDMTQATLGKTIPPPAAINGRIRTGEGATDKRVITESRERPTEGITEIDYKKADGKNAGQLQGLPRPGQLDGPPPPQETHQPDNRPHHKQNHPSHFRQLDCAERDARQQSAKPLRLLQPSPEEVAGSNPK